ncbi:MFS transporter [Candidatus Nitrosacidococcus sp. I8]|uniref:MFS transporter n=1 Tax=Candidatus Nitrosacidococcus sp. I8 TaxID=2942908 RepID=UPI002227D3E8|nr:MFS transporter [Candidatus Nitrosacidococcus sp. I8]CAH9018716.1 putative MFS-type transporter [Candidatus Nitrosacidococcus sp. I8]
MKQYPALDWLNFFIADVKDGLGPFLAIYLASQHWSTSNIGIVMAILGVATVLARIPMGGLVDQVVRKRELIAVSAGIVAICSVITTYLSGFWSIAITQTVIGIFDTVFPPAIAAISLGIVGASKFTRQVSRNEAFNHGGNILSALLAGVAGWWINPGAVLWFVAFMAIFSIGTVLKIDSKIIDYKAARGATKDQQAPMSFTELFKYPPLLIFTTAITLFHFANAAMLPLIGQKVAQDHPNEASLVMGACIIVAQVIMIPMAIYVGRKADIIGRKPIFLVGFLVLPIRGFLYTLSDNSYYLVSVQLLDGIGAGIFGALFYIVIADLTRGTGRYNLTLGAASACWGLGAALSNLVAGYIADHLGYNTAFLFLSGMGIIALLLLWLAMPETLHLNRSNQIMSHT